MARRAIHGRRAIVTGASDGIGRQLVLELCRHGAQVLAVARRGRLLQALASETQRIGPAADVLVGDVTEPSVRRAIVAHVEGQWGGLDILINNAGVSAQGLFASATPERLRRIMEVNFFAAAELIRATMPMLVRGNQPIVVNVGSILGHRAVPFNSEYCASKFALRGLSEALRAELVQPGVDVLLVSPGTTDTHFFDHLLERTREMPWRSPRAVSAASVARAIVRAIKRRKYHIVPSWQGRLLLWVNRLAPWLVERWMRGYGITAADQNCSQPR